MKIAFPYGLKVTMTLLHLVCMATAGNRSATDSSSVLPAEPVVPIPHPLTMLLHAETVLRELGLSRVQETAVGAAVDQADLSLWRLRDLPLAERNHKARVILDSLRAAVSAALTPPQRERLDQLLRRASGIHALLEPDVTATLGLSPDQRHRIQMALAALPRGAGPAARIRVEGERNLLTILTDRQRRSLAGLLGPPFPLAAVRAVACRAPELVGVTTWIHSTPLRLEQLRGKVVVVHFYAFGCINCVRNLPHYNDWHERFDRDKCVVIGIHRPETKQEQDVYKVRQKAAEAGIQYAVAVDNESHNWNAWANRIWPSVYLIDKGGFVRYWWYGELNWQGTPGEPWMRDRIAELIAEPYQRTSPPQAPPP